MYTVIIVLLVIITFLTIKLRKTKKIEEHLKHTNEELLEVYESLAASDEELKTQYHKLEENRSIIKKNEERYRLVSEASDDGFWDLDFGTNEFFSNDKLATVLGIDKEEADIYINNLEKYIHPEDMTKVVNIINELRCGLRDSYSLEHRSLDKSGKYRWILAKGKMLRDEYNKPARISGFHIDIENRKVQEEQIKTLAYFDTVTKLPNRSMFYKKMIDILIKSRSEKQSGLVLYMDIDNFKIINDTFGHDFGDLLLREVAKRLQKLETRPRSLFRISGDEYIIVLQDYNENSPERIANKIQEVMSVPFIIDQNEIQISMSIGLVVYPKDALDVDELLRKADLAMYKAKELGKNQYKLYETSLEDEITDRLLLENHLRYALGRGEFVLNYQPQIDTTSGEVIGFEALIRWFSPEYGFVSPMKFIPIAEEMGLINKIGEWILREACEFSIKMNEKSNKKIVISINISPIQLNQDNFIEIVKKVISDTNVNPSIIGIEITETSLMETFEENSKKLEKLRELGVKVSLDDFGTGYSSLNYLLRLPIHIIKIDRSFILNMTTDKRGIKIIESIINLAHNMGLDVVAEGVETSEQLEILKSLNCDIIQGYIFGKPLAEDDSILYIEEGMNI